MRSWIDERSRAVLHAWQRDWLRWGRRHQSKPRVIADHRCWANRNPPVPNGRRARRLRDRRERLRRKQLLRLTPSRVIYTLCTLSPIEFGHRRRLHYCPVDDSGRERPVCQCSLHRQLVHDHHDRLLYPRPIEESQFDEKAVLTSLPVRVMFQFTASGLPEKKNHFQPRGMQRTVLPGRHCGAGGAVESEDAEGAREKLVTKLRLRSKAVISRASSAWHHASKARLSARFCSLRTTCVCMCVCVCVYNMNAKARLSERIPNPAQHLSRTVTMYVYMFVYIHIYVCMHACMHTYMHTYMHVCMHACVSRTCRARDRSLIVSQACARHRLKARAAPTLVGHSTTRSTWLAAPEPELLLLESCSSSASILLRAAAASFALAFEYSWRLSCRLHARVCV